MLQVVWQAIPCGQSRRTLCSQDLSLRVGHSFYRVWPSQRKPPALREARRLTVLRWAHVAKCSLAADPGFADESSQSDCSKTNRDLTGSRAQDHRKILGWRVAKVVLLGMMCVWFVQAAPAMAKAVTTSPSTGNLTFGDALKGEANNRAA